MWLFTLVCGWFFVWTAATQAQEARQAYVLPRVGETIDAQEARYFLLFRDWPRDVYERYEKIAVQAVVQSDDSVRFEWIPGREDLADIRVSEAAAEVLSFYLDHFEEMRTQASPYDLLSHPELPKHMQAHAQELIDRDVLLPWWPKWSNMDDGGLVEVTLKTGTHVSCRLLGLTNKRIILWTKDYEFSHLEMSDNLLVLPYGEVDTVVVKRPELGLLGWIGMYAGLAYMNLRMEPGPEDYWMPGLDFLRTTFGRSVGIAIGSLGFLLPNEQRYEYIPSQFGVERLDQSQLWESIWKQPGLAPEIVAMLDTAKGERLIRRVDAPPLMEVHEAERRRPPGGWWIGGEQLEVNTTEHSGYRTGVSFGYDFLWSYPAGDAGIGVGTLLGVSNNSISTAVHGFIRLRFLQLTAGVRGWLQQNVLHESRDSWSYLGGGSSETSYHTQRPSAPDHYLYREFGFDFVMRGVSVGLHFLSQFAPSVTVEKHWSRYSYTDSSHIESGVSFETDIHIYAWAISLRIWL